MSEQIVNKTVFKDLKKVILKNKESGVISKSSEVVSIAFSDLIYSITSDKVETISFNVLKLDLILNPDDSLVLMEMDAGDVQVYELDSSPMEQKLLAHLSWRIEVLNEFNF